MPRLPRVPERTATAEELSEDRRRCIEARKQYPSPVGVRVTPTSTGFAFHVTWGKNGRPELPAVAPPPSGSRGRGKAVQS
jgi:hypothetical protein